MAKVCLAGLDDPPESTRAALVRWGKSASTTLRPVCRGFITGARSMMGGASRITASRLLASGVPFSVQRPPQRIHHPADQVVTDRYIQNAAASHDLVPRTDSLAGARTE